MSAISSLLLPAKGGVGKIDRYPPISLSPSPKKGARVGLIDADIYGPSQHIMFGVENEQLYVNERDGKPIHDRSTNTASRCFRSD